MTIYEIRNQPKYSISPKANSNTTFLEDISGIVLVLRKLEHFPMLPSLYTHWGELICIALTLSFSSLLIKHYRNYKC